MGADGLVGGGEVSVVSFQWLCMWQRYIQVVVVVLDGCWSEFLHRDERDFVVIGDAAARHDVVLQVELDGLNGLMDRM